MRETIDFGIDLGTTNSAMAVAEGGAITVIKNNDGWDYTPSAVWIPKPGKVHVGRRARYGAVSEPDNVASEFKLEMGLAGAGRRFANAGVTLTPVELSAEVLRALRADAAHQCGEAPIAAVITVPAAFALNQNAATSEAAALAGLGTACPLVQEPTAAAFAYGLADASDRAYWMVFDFGGGTFDAAVVSKRDGELLVLNHAGDPYLGGKLIDWALAERLLAPATARALDLSDFTRDNAAWRVNFGKLKLAAEEAKIELSRLDSVDIDIDLTDGRGGTENFEYTMTRGELDRIAEPFYVRAVNHCRDALREGNLDPDDIDRLLLVGGTTLTPGLRERLADAVHGLGIAVDHTQDPTTVVARGAAIYARTVRLETPLAPPRPGEFTVELTYPTTVSALTPSVGGRLHSGSAVDWTRYSVTLDNPAGRPPFRSPRIAVSADGTFLTEVSLVPDATSRFTVELTDPSGTRQLLTPDSLTITHGDEFGGPVLTHSLGFGRADRVFAPMLRKGTALPARTRESFRTTIALRRSDTESVIRIPIVEGERGRADRNREVGLIELRPRDVRIDLPAGSDVELTFEIDESRLVTVFADVPLVSEQFEAEIDLSNLRPPDPAVLEKQLAEVQERRDQLRESADAVGSTKAKGLLARLDDESTIENVREDVHTARVDIGTAAKSDQLLRDAQARLDDIEDAVQLPRLLDQLRIHVDQCADLVTEVGDADDRRELADLERRSRAAIEDRDPAAARMQVDRAVGFYVDLLGRTDRLELTVFSYYRNNPDRLRPADRVPALIREGEQAIAAGDRRALAGVNERLRRLRPPDEQDLVGGLMPS
ncbi:MAG: Hsp70 family protein [Pseudonocardia sp.]